MGLNASTMFANGIQKIHENTLDWDTHTFRACLVKKSYANTTLDTTTVDTHDFLNDVPAGDRSSGNFTVVGTTDISIDGANDHVNFGGGTVTIVFTTVTNGTSCRGIVIFKSSGATTTASPLVCYNHFTSNVTADGGNVTVTINASGLFRASY